MIGVKLQPLLVLVTWISVQYQVEANSNAIAAFELLTSTRDVQDRDMQNWWNEYTKKINDYRSIRNQSICTDPETLSSALDNLQVNIQRVRFGWNSKMEQLQKIADILHDEKYKNITGLHEAIGHYIENANKTATDEDVRLKEEEAEVSAEKKYFEGRVCDCIWNEWGSWGQCSKTCDEGTKTRERTVVRQATNGGQACEEDMNGSEQDSCLVIRCPIDCTWSEWTIWSECSDKCSDGINTRTRQVESPSMYNGTCEGTNQEARPCNNMKALQQVIANLQKNNTELLNENRKLKEKLDTMEPKSTKGLPPQCQDYKTLDETSRHYTHTGRSYKCDRDPRHNKSPQWSGESWYRFTGAAGTKMATKKEVTKKNICGTHAAGHLDTNTHPDLAEGQSQDQKVCFYWDRQCYWSTTVTIQKCDGFYIYKLPNPPACSLRYCGA